MSDGVCQFRITASGDFGKISHREFGRSGSRIRGFQSSGNFTESTREDRNQGFASNMTSAEVTQASGFKTTQKKILTREEQMMQTASFKFLRREQHKARSELNKQSAVSISCSKFQLKNIDKVSESWRPIRKQVEPLSERVPLAHMIRENLRLKMNHQLISLTDGKDFDGNQYTAGYEEIHQEAKTKKIEILTRYLFNSKETNLKLEEKPSEKGTLEELNPQANQTLDLDMTAANITPFGLMHSRVYFDAPVIQVNQDSINLAKHLKIMDRDYSSFVRKLKSNKLTYKVPEGVIPDPKHLNEFYRIEKHDKLDLVPFEELEKMYRPPLEPLDNMYLGEEEEEQKEEISPDNDLQREDQGTSDQPPPTSEVEVLKRNKKKRVVPAWAPRHPRFSIKTLHRPSMSLKNNTFSMRKSFMTELDSLKQDEASLNDQKENSYPTKDDKADIKELPSELELVENSNQAEPNLDSTDSPLMSKNKSIKKKPITSMKSNQPKDENPKGKKPKISFATLAKTTLAFGSKKKEIKFTFVPKMLTVNSFRPMSSFY